MGKPAPESVDVAMHNLDDEKDIKVNLASSDTGEATVSPATLIFTEDNWDTPRTVTLTGKDDTDLDGHQDYQGSLSTSVSKMNDSGSGSGSSQATVATVPPLQNPSSAYNASSNKYVVSTLGHLSYIAQNSSFLAYNFIQTANIDATVTKFWDDEDSNSDGDKYNDANDVTDSGNNEGFLPIGNQVDSFRGKYHGNKKAINGLTITRNSNNYTGLFGWAILATISNIGLSNVNIIGQDSVGQLVGLAHSTHIINCYATSGTVTGNNNVGGLIGYLYGYASITNSYSKVDNITASSSSIGGLVGYIENSTVLNSYSTGSVVSTNISRGGLVGTYYPIAPTDSFYDKTTSGQSDTGKGIGKTTAEMKTKATFTDTTTTDLSTSWDFDTIWNIDNTSTINGGYPYLR